MMRVSSLRGASRWVFLLPILQPLPAARWGLLVQGGGEQSQSDPRRDKPPAGTSAWLASLKGIEGRQEGEGERNTLTVIQKERELTREQEMSEMLVVEDSWFSPAGLSPVSCHYPAVPLIWKGVRNTVSALLNHWLWGSTFLLMFHIFTSLLCWNKEWMNQLVK